MKKRNNIIFPFIIFLSLGILAFGCSSREETHSTQSSSTSYTSPLYDWTSEGSETLTLWAQEPEMDRIYMKRAIKNYESSTGNKINVVQFPKEEFLSSVSDAFLNKTQAPDLLLSYGGTNLDRFHPDENLYDFTDAVWVDDLTDTSITQTVYHGKIIGLPHWEASISGTLYNKDIFSKFGITLPANQSEFMDVCEKLLSHGITPLYMPFVDPSMMLYQFPLDTIVSDTDTLQGLNDNSLSYSTLPEMKHIVEWYKTMADRGYFGQNFEENAWDGMNDALKSGEYAMMLCWDTWLYTDFDGDAGSFGLMPAFMGIPDSGTFEGPNLALVTVNKNSDKLDAAINFVTFLADPYNYNQAFDGIYTAPVFKRQTASISTPQYTEAERLIESNYNDSVAWLRVRGFSQTDASCIRDYITSSDMSASDCLEKMDQMRNLRITD